MIDVNTDYFETSPVVVPSDTLRDALVGTCMHFLDDSELPNDLRPATGEYLNYLLDRVDGRVDDADERILQTAGLADPDEPSSVNVGRTLHEVGRAMIARHEEAVADAWPATEQQRRLDDARAAITYTIGHLQTLLYVQGQQPEGSQ